VVEDGAAAIEAVRTGHYDLVLMDVQMPGVDGLGAPAGSASCRSRRPGCG
jgi:CheY-like chemotaxis protein